MRLFGGNCKKGNAVTDTATIVVLLVIFGLVSIVSYFAFDAINTQIVADTDLDAVAINATSNYHANYPSIFDGLILFILVLFVIFTIISTFLIDTKPIFFIVTVIMLVAVFVLAALVSNAFEDIAEDNTLAAASSSFPFTNWVMSHLLQIAIGVGFLIAITLYAKFR